MSNKEVCPTFGCVPFTHVEGGDVRVLMILNTSEGDHWEFPKGMQDEGETGVETAVRELKEETGLTGELVEGKFIDLEFDSVFKGEKCHKTVRYYFCKVSPDAAVVPQESEIRAYEWLKLDELEERATYPEMKGAAREVVAVLSKRKV